jgi:transposase-like protein
MPKTKQQQKREVWRQRVIEYRASGQSSAAWCAAQGIKPHLLHYWTQQFTLSTETETETGTAPEQWQPVIVSDRQCQEASSMIHVRIGAATIDVFSGFDGKVLADVVRVLTAIC